MPIDSTLINGSLDDAIEALARQSVMRKQAFMEGLGQQLSSLGSQAGDYFKNMDPMAQKALVGAGVGGGLGLASSAFSDKEDKKPLSNALTGALAGGAVGAGAGLVGKYLPETTGKPKPGALQENQFIPNQWTSRKLPGGNQPHEWTQPLSSETATRISKLRGKTDSNNLLTPEAIAAGATGAAGAGSIAAGLKYNASQSSSAPSWLKRTFSPYGDIAAKDSQVPEHLSRGLSKATGDPAGGGAGKGSALDNILKNLDIKNQDIEGLDELGRKTKFTATHADDARRAVTDLYDSGKDAIKRVTDNPESLLPHDPTNSRKIVAKLKELGATTGDTPPRLRQSLLGSWIPGQAKQVVRGSKRSMIGRGAKYGIPMALAGYIAARASGALQGRSANSQLADIFKQHAKPVQ